MKVRLVERALVVELGGELRCLSSAVLGGGLGRARTWFNLQVPSHYACTDPQRDLEEASAGMDRPVVGMMTAARVSGFRQAWFGCARAVGTVGGTGHALAATGVPSHSGRSAGTINLLIVVEAPLTDAGLVGALQTAVEAKAQALAAAGIRALNAPRGYPGFATGTATDSICIACPPGERVSFAGSATRVGGELARAAYEVVRLGALAEVTAGAPGCRTLA
ncbi:MAG: adenosylcobinamide amidohydrolase [Actinomycetota bacterium]